MKKYGKNWWIKKGKTKYWCCPFCGKRPDVVLNGKYKFSYTGGHHNTVTYIECSHKEINPNGKFDFPTKFKIEEPQRFPRNIGEMGKDEGK